MSTEIYITLPTCIQLYTHISFSILNVVQPRPLALTLELRTIAMAWRSISGRGFVEIHNSMCNASIIVTWQVLNCQERQQGQNIDLDSSQTNGVHLGN